MKRKGVLATAGMLAAVGAMAAYWQAPRPQVIGASTAGATIAEPMQQSLASAGPSVQSDDAPAPFSLRDRVSIAVAPDAHAVAIGDVTGDGRDDVVVVLSGAYSGPGQVDGNVRIYAQEPDGSLRAPLQLTMLAPAFWSPGLVLADLNNDAVDDIIVQHDRGITLMVANGAGGFDTKLLTGGAPTGYPLLATADVDLDGNLDILVQGSGTVSTLYLGDGLGGVKGSRTLPGGDRRDLKLGDVTGDGLPDLVVSAGDLIVYPHNGVDGFGAPRIYPKPEAWWGAGLTIADFNGDGRNDIAIGEHKNTPTQVWVLYQDTAGDLQPRQSVPSYDSPSILLASDLDRDGRDDLVVVHTGWGSVSFHLQGDNGLGSEQLILNQPTQNVDPHALAAGDINGDGCSDVAMVSQGAMHLYYGQDCKPLAPAAIADDVNGDRRSDLLWRTDDGRNWAYWIMSGAVHTDGMGYQIGAGWKIAARGDFTGDGRLDLVWTDGNHMQMWKRTSGGYEGLAMPDYPQGYRVVASGDIDGDGKADLVWRDPFDSVLAVWRMDGNRVIDGRNSWLSNGWQVAATGDLDGDRRLDLVVTNGVRMESMSGRANLTFRQAAMGGYPSGWTLVGLSDVDGDGTSNLLWRHPAGYFVTWNMRGPRRVSGLTYEVPGEWRVISMGDFDGNGSGDIVWTNGRSTQMWASSEAGFAGLVLPDYPPGWSVIPPP